MRCWQTQLFFLTMVRDEKSRVWINAPWQDESLDTEQSKDEFFSPIIKQLKEMKAWVDRGTPDDLSAYSWWEISFINLYAIIDWKFQ